MAEEHSTANACTIGVYAFNASRLPTIASLHNAPSAVLISNISVLAGDKTHANADNKLKVALSHDRRSTIGSLSVFASSTQYAIHPRI